MSANEQQSEPLKPGEHAPGHRYGVQAGPHGMFARWCLVDGCTWRDTTGEVKRKDAGHASTALVLLVCIFGALAFLAFLSVGQDAMCSLHKDQPPVYCEAQR